MKLSLALLVGLVGFVSAAAIDRGLAKRDNLTVQLCKDLNLVPGGTGGCTLVSTLSEGCAELSDIKAGGPFTALITSAQIPPGATKPYRCTLFSATKCAGKSLVIAGAVNDLRKFNFDDTTTSVSCALV